jgi:hypothetical protein
MVVGVLLAVTQTPDMSAARTKQGAGPAGAMQSLTWSLNVACGKVQPMRHDSHCGIGIINTAPAPATTRGNLLKTRNP